MRLALKRPSNRAKICPSSTSPPGLRRRTPWVYDWILAERDYAEESKGVCWKRNLKRLWEEMRRPVEKFELQNSLPVGEDDEPPHGDAIHITQEDRCAGHVFRPLRHGVLRGRNVVDGPLDRGVQQLDDDDKKQRCDHHRGADRLNREDDGERSENDDEYKIFAE